MGLERNALHTMLAAQGEEYVRQAAKLATVNAKLDKQTPPMAPVEFRVINIAYRGKQIAAPVLMFANDQGPMQALFVGEDGGHRRSAH